MPTDPKLHVLAVDDEETMLSTVKRALARFGFRVDGVTTGEEAVQRASQAPYDAYIVDMKMEPHDGLWTCKELLRLDPGAVVVMVSGQDAEAVKVAALNAGADDYVLKPFGPEELATRIRKHVQKSAESIHPGADSGGAGRFPLRVDRQTGVVTLFGKTLDLTCNERRLLALLVARRGTILSLAQVRSRLQLASEGAARTLLSVTRRKLGKGNKLIETVRGQGIRLRNAT